MRSLTQSASDGIAERARKNGCSPAKQAIYEGITPDFHMWTVPKEINENEDSGDYSAVQLISEDDTPRKNDVISRMARAIAKEIQFPVSTAYMHAVGCVASAMTPRFSVAYHGDELPVCLYIATSQPPSSGKSAVNNKLMKPVSHEFDQLNKKNWKERRRLLAKIAELEDSIKKEGKGAPREAIEAQEMEIADLTDKLSHWPVFTYPVTDATPEALAKIAAQENGIFNLISDEASALNTVLGLTYKTDGKANSELVLKAWDGGRISSRRASGDNLTFDARGNVCVIAQDEVIDAILQAGERGNGLTERFLIVREAHKMGARVFIDDAGEIIDRSAPPDVIAAYAGLVHNLVSCDANIVFKLSRQAEKCMNIRRQVMEEAFCDNGKWSHPLLRGAMGKMDKQVYKLASVLHASKHWCSGGDKSTVIDDETITAALSLYDGIAQTFVDATSSQGYAGENSEMNAIIAKMAKYYESKRTMTSVRELYQDLRKVKPFKGVTGLQKRLEEKLMPELEDKGYCVVRDKYIHINPKITGR